jgi:hypothetical protein
MRTHVRTAGIAACAVVLALFAVSPLMAQGVTTAAIRGRLLDDAGSPVVGATVILMNASTGQRVQGVSRAGGLYSLENVPVGGPYTLEARYIGYQAARRSSIVLSLGQVLGIDLRMERAAVELEAIVATAEEQERLFSPATTGTELTVSDSLLRRLPTLDRSFTDFVRLTPQVAEPDFGGISVAGQNNRFNTIQVDGSTVNDRFGLGSTGLTGGQAQGRAVGLEAVKEYQVLLAPYDVRQGNFTGALINAVTKSGTNTLFGSAFYYFRNQSLAGDPLGLTDFSRHQFGGAVGGPILRDKAHFFVNAEFRRSSRPAAGPYVGQPGTVGPVKASQADVDAFNAALGTYGLPNTGVGTLVSNKNPLANLLARLDYQVGGSSRLTFRYIYNDATDDIFSRSTGTTFDLSTAGYRFENRTHNPSLQFITNFGSGASNEVLFSWNRIRDRRNPNVTAPLIIVQNFDAADGSGVYNLQSGAERFSQGNELDQDIYEFTDNLTFPMGAHRITVGTRNEIYRVRNLFAQSSYGVWTFDDVADFEAGVVEQYESAGDLGAGIAATFTAGIFGVYVQDQWQVTPKFSVVGGVRVDVPTFFDQPTYDQRVIDDGFATDVPSGHLMFAPRVGFNYDLGGRQTQVRGGAGLFTGTPAYVWYSNAYSNNGTKIGRVTCTGTNVPVFSTELGGPLACADGTGIADGSTIGEVNTVADGTRFPQVLRMNLAVDRRLPGNLLGTAEFIYTKGVNDFFIVNRNLGDPVGDDANGRVMYGTFNANGTVSPNYVDVGLYGPSFNGGVYELRNTNNNYSWSLTTQLQKRFSQSWEGNIGYTYSQSKDVQSFTSSRAISNWRFGRSLSGSQLEDGAGTSAFHRPHRLVAGITYTFPWRSIPTDISFSYVGQSGGPYTLIAGGGSGRGDLNADGTNTNDPIYLPMDPAAEMEFADITNGASAAEQAAAFNQYLAEDACLAAQRGAIMERNSCRNPWQSFLNVTLRQTLPRFGNNTLMLEVGIFNLLNLLDEDWGRAKTVGGGVFNDVTMLNAVAPGAGQGPQVFQFDPSQVTERYRPTSSTNNSYQIQMGLRYAF